MSIYTAMRAGVSGLSANSSAMAVIADNIANVNTTGFKRGQSDFTALVNSQGAATSSYNAGGVITTNRRLVELQGSLEQTRSSTDLAVSGDGFFIVTDDPEAAGAASGGLFTRSGAFSLDRNGRLLNSQGLYLLGARIDPENAASLSTPASLAALTPIDLSGVGSSAEATTRLTIVANLDATVVGLGPPGAIPDYIPGALSGLVPDPAAVQPPPSQQDIFDGNYAGFSGASLAPGAAPPLIQPDLLRTVEVYDSLGRVRTINLAFKKISDVTNRWAFEAYWVNPTTNTPQWGVMGVIQFDPQGRPLGNLPAAAPAGTGGSGFPSSFFINWGEDDPDPANPPDLGEGLETGAAPQTISLTDNVTGQSFLGGLTQFAERSALRSATADGSPPGELTGVTVTRDGLLTADFSNGRNQSLYRIPLATFLNPSGLFLDSRGAYRQTIDSGLITINTPGLGGAGIIQANALEASNVDLGTEFTNMITTQRAYSASSRIITTADEMLEELLRIKR